MGLPGLAAVTGVVTWRSPCVSTVARVSMVPGVLRPRVPVSMPVSSRVVVVVVVVAAADLRRSRGRRIVRRVFTRRE